MNTSEAISSIQQHADAIREGREKIRPGDPAYFTPGCVPGERIWQGDLCITLASFDTALQVKQVPAPKDGALVPDNGTVGSHHRLDSLDGVIFIRSLPTKDNSLDGPAFIVAQPRVITHPKHGHVHLCPGTYEIGYQRELDRDLQAERRARD